MTNLFRYDQIIGYAVIKQYEENKPYVVIPICFPADQTNKFDELNRLFNEATQPIELLSILPAQPGSFRVMKKVDGEYLFDRYMVPEHPVDPVGDIERHIERLIDQLENFSSIGCNAVSALELAAANLRS